MTRRFLFIALAVVTLLATRQQAAAQLRTTLAVVASYDDNLFRNNLTQGDLNTNSSLSLDYTPPESDFNFFASGSAGMFRQFSDRRFFAGTLGGMYTTAFGEQGQNNFSVTSSYFARFNTGTHDVYNLSQFIGSANLKYYLDFDNGFMGRIGYRLRYRSYRNLDQFTYTEHLGVAQLSKFFQTKTTVIVEFNLGNKQYSAVPTTVTTASSGGSSEHGGMHGSSGWMNSGDDGEMMESSQWNYGSHTGSIITYSTPNTTQLTALARVAQSLGATTGLSLQYLRRLNVTDRTRFITSSGTDFQGDAELWDDPYGYEGNEFSTVLTQILPWDITARLSAEYLLKNYSRRVFSAADTDIPTGPFRDDTKAVAGIGLTKKFGEGFFSELTLSLSYMYQRNTSNDPYYDYANNVISIGAVIGL